MSKRPLAPKLLNKLDNYLLVNRPDTWSTRLHLVLYYGFLSLLAFGTICFFIPNDPRSDSAWGIWTFATVVLSLIAFIIWLVYLFRFNVFKQYGKVHHGDRLKTFLIYYFIIALMILPSFVPRFVESFRADQAYSSEELVGDINRMNVLICQMEYDNIPQDWHVDTVQIVNGNDDSFEYSYKYTRIDTVQLRYRKENGDSIKKVNTGLYEVLTFYDAQFVNNYNVKEHSGLHLKTKLDLYYSVFKNHVPVNRNAAQTELQTLLDKYSCTDCRSYYYGDYNYNYDTETRKKYDLQAVNAGIDNIASRKYYITYRHFSETIFILSYVALVLTLLVYIFRHSTVRTFFVSILFGIVVSILSGLLVVLFRLRAEGLMTMILIYYSVFVVVALLTFIRKHRSVINGIAINLVVFMTAFVPITCVNLYYVELMKTYAERGDYDSFWVDRQYYYMVAQIAGPLLLLILVETLFKRLYRIWYASPEE